MKTPKTPKTPKKLYKFTGADICKLHYRHFHFPSDIFYVKTANQIYPIIHRHLAQESRFTDKELRELTITLVGYVEDLVAGSGIWAAFTSIHEKKYGTKLPFYTDEPDADFIPYDDECPSLNAVRFLIWYTLNEYSPDTFLNPCNIGISMLALELMPTLIDAYEEAPESPARPAIVDEALIGVPVFYQIRNVCKWLCSDCYLTRIHNSETCSEELESIFSEMFGSQMEKDQVKYGIDTFIPFHALIGPLAITPQEWLAEIMTLYHEDEEIPYISIVKELKALPLETYSYLEVGSDTAELVNAAGEKFTLDASTLPGELMPSNVKKGDSALLSLVFYNGKWVFNSLGILSLPPEFYTEYKQKYLEKRKEGEDSFKAVFKVLKKKRIGVCRNYDEYMQMFHADDSWKKLVDSDTYHALNDVDNLLYFLNDNGQVSLMPDFGSCVKLRGNKYYDKKTAADKGFDIIIDHGCSTPDLRRYLIDKKLVPDAAMNSIISKKAGRDLFQNNIRFLNDYMDKDTIPRIMD